MSLSVQTHIFRNILSNDNSGVIKGALYIITYGINILLDINTRNIVTVIELHMYFVMLSIPILNFRSF